MVAGQCQVGCRGGLVWWVGCLWLRKRKGSMVGWSAGSVCWSCWPRENGVEEYWSRVPCVQSCFIACGWDGPQCQVAV